MKQKITIEVDVKEGYQLTYNPTTKTIEEVPIEHIRSRSWEEFCENHPDSTNEWYLAPSTHNIGKCNNPNCREITGLLATKEDAEGILALIQLTRLHDEWVGNWKPDYNDNETEKWYIHFFRDEIDIAWSNSHNRFLAFPTGEMAKEFLESFKDLIEQAKKFL